MQDLKPGLKSKVNSLELWFKNRKGSIVAFSGGVDSSFVLYMARKFQGKENVIGVISNSESLKHKDFLLAQSFCDQFDINLHIIKTLELSDLRYSENPINRCYFCKDHLFKDLQKLKQEFPNMDVLSGTNHNDLGDYRPGIDAAKENQVLSPLVDCEISKDELREMARYFNLPNWNKPASPCLSSRIPYNQSVTVGKLKQVEDAEDLLNDYGFEDVRVRHYGALGKIEVAQSDLGRLIDMKNEIVPLIKAIGFKTVEIDAEGLVSGKLNRVLKDDR